MKLIDRYLLRQFLVPLGSCLVAFSMIFVIADLFDHFSDFIEAGTPFLQAVRYYVYLLPTLLVFIAPVSLLLGTLYSLWQLTRNSELTAMRACGISFHRIIVPYIAVGVLFSVLVGICQELVAPKSSQQATRFIEGLKMSDNDSSDLAQNLSFRNDAASRTWFIGSFNMETYETCGVRIDTLSADGITIIEAEKARYEDGRWLFFNGSIKSLDADNRLINIERFSDSEQEMADLTEKPEDFINEINPPLFLSAREILRYRDSKRNLEEKRKAQLDVDMHSLWAMPWTCIIVTLFGIPCGVHTGRKGPFVGVMLALSSFFGFYVLMVFGQWLGKEQVLNPVSGAWLPNFVFLAAGIWLVVKAR